MPISPRDLALLPLRAIVFLVSWLVPRNDRLWTFMSGGGDRFADNAKYLFLYCENKDEVRNVWIGTDDDLVDELRAEGYEAYVTDSLQGKYAMLRAGVFFETHGPIAPAYTGGARIVHLTHGNYLKTMLEDHARDWPRVMDVAVELAFERRRQYVITGDGPPMENMKSMRGAPEECMLVTGFPRNDILFRERQGELFGLNEQALAQVTKTAHDRTVFLYAPTHREAYDEQNGVPLEELYFGFERLNELLAAEDGHLYISPHPASTFDPVLEGYEHIELLDTGGDLYPFLRECDVLLTDYSGVFYDFLVLDRPVLFYAPDLEAYLNDRDLYFEYEDHVPGPIATDPDELVGVVRETLDGTDEHASERQAVLDQFYDDPDSEASERVYRAVVGDAVPDRDPDRY